MKNKKLLWPWTKRKIPGETKVSRQHTAAAKDTDKGSVDDPELSYNSRPIEISEWFHTFMCMNIPVYGWFYLKKIARQQEHNKLQDFAKAYLYYKMVFLAVSLVIVILLLIIGIFSINKLFAYMELL